MLSRLNTKFLISFQENIGKVECKRTLGQIWEGWGWSITKTWVVTFQLLNPSTHEFTLLVYIHFFFKLCDPFNFCFMISSLILLSIADDSVLMMWGEMKCWSLQRIKHVYRFELYLQWCTALAMGPFSLISSYFNCLEMKTFNSFKSAF